MQINEELQISTKTKICPSMESNMWQVRKSNDIKSFIKCVILAIHVHNRIKPTGQRGVSQKKA